MVTMSSVVLATIGPVAGSLLAAAGYVLKLVITGDLVPRKYLEDSVARETTWRQAYEQSDQARRLVTDQVAKFVEISRTTSAVIAGSLPAVAQQPDGGTGVPVA